jgi:hypothetical protein
LTNAHHTFLPLSEAYQTTTGEEHTFLPLSRAYQANAAQDAWQRAREANPWQYDTLFLLASARGKVDRARPRRLQEEYSPLLDVLADRFLKADMFDLLGDAYFEAGHMNDARLRYADSAQAFTLPKVINHRALMGLGGL